MQMENFIKFIKYYGKNRKIGLFCFSLLSITAGFLEFFGIALVYPFILLIIKPESIVNNKYYVVTPIRHQQKQYAGKVIPVKSFFDMDSTCIFLDEETRKCAIHDVKPLGGRNGGCWKDPPPAIEQYYWKRKDLKKFMIFLKRNLF